MLLSAKMPLRSSTAHRLRETCSGYEAATDRPTTITARRGSVLCSPLSAAARPPGRSQMSPPPPPPPTAAQGFHYGFRVSNLNQRLTIPRTAARIHFNAAVKS